MINYLTDSFSEFEDIGMTYTLRVESRIEVGGRITIFKSLTKLPDGSMDMFIITKSMNDYIHGYFKYGLKYFLQLDEEFDQDWTIVVTKFDRMLKVLKDTYKVKASRQGMMIRIEEDPKI